jgi:hypothetical protein
LPQHVAQFVPGRLLMRRALTEGERLEALSKGTISGCTNFTVDQPKKRIRHKSIENFHLKSNAKCVLCWNYLSAIR